MYRLKFLLKLDKRIKAAVVGDLRDRPFVFQQQFAGVADADFVYKIDEGFV